MAVHELFAYICVKNAEEAIRFYRTAFGATEKWTAPAAGAQRGPLPVSRTISSPSPHRRADMSHATHGPSRRMSHQG